MARLALAAVLLAAAPSFAEDAAEARGILVEEIKNPAPAFHVRVTVDHADRAYKSGEEVKVTVHAGRDGYLYLFYLDAAGKTWLLFPNFVQKENAVAAGKPVTVPAPDAKFRFKVGKPFGKELLKAVVATKPIAAKGFEIAALTKQDATEIDTEKLRDFARSVKADGGDWAEHEIEITTADPAAAAPKKAGPKRVGLFVGVGKYTHLPANKQLPVCPADAKQAAEAFKKHCGLEEAVVLVDAEATPAKVEAAIKKAAAVTRPGDTFVFFWSGHGAIYLHPETKEPKHSLMLTDSPAPALTEKSSREEILKAFETLHKTTLNSDQLQRWLQGLDGRRVVVIADACHAGGLHKRTTLQLENVGRDIKEEPFLGDILRRSKTLDQKDLALLAGSTWDQESLVRREQDLSLLTYEMLEVLKSGDGPLNLKQVHEGVGKAVEGYAQRVFKKSQQPVLVDQMAPSPTFYLRPAKGH
jgi:hypothetical protein